MNLLLFNLATDAEDPILGFTTVWLSALARHCDQIHVITVRQGRLDLPDNVSVYSVGKEQGYGKLRRGEQFYRHLAHVLRSTTIDACFAHMNPLFAVMAAPLLKARRIPITLWYAHKSVTLKLRVAEKLVDQVVTSSPEGFRLPSRKVLSIGQGIDTDRFGLSPISREADRPFTVVSVGRLSPVKGLETLIKATDRLVRHHRMENLSVRLVGPVYDVAYAERLRRLVADRGLGGVVHFVGALPHEQVSREYRQADAFVNLSSTGSADKAVLEAMSCGIPVLTSNVAFERVLGSLASSAMVAKGDAVGLAERLWMLAELSPQERRAAGQQLRRVVVSRHSLEVLARRLAKEILPGRHSLPGTHPRERRI
jgi:glycosyltransferase involved in cell wall biosynthesis